MQDDRLQDIRLHDIRCTRCHALLFRAGPRAIAGAIEIKCRRCGTLAILRPLEPTPERQEREPIETG